MNEPDSADDHFRGTDRFEIRRRIGTGGFGFVYEAWDRERKERVAIKTLRVANPETIRILKNEFRVVRDIDHPNLVRLGELFEHEGEWFFTMEFIEGAGIIRFVRPSDSEAGISSIEREAPPPPSGVFDEPRLRSVLGQLVRGLSTLHAADKVHRDVKPANLIVEASGRLVVLDFGIVADMGRAAVAIDTGVTGTPHFMAPEQAVAEEVGPASDWYAVGVILFRCLVGRLPFFGDPRQVLEDKLVLDAPVPRALLPELPEDLSDLCVDLLRCSPDERPTGLEIIERLEGPVARAELELAIASRVFVGRAPELDRLAHALGSARSGRASTVMIHGESGVGKSCLVRHFMQAASESDHDLTWFQGRCYERESVPFKAFDGIVDQISELLSNFTEAEIEGLVPLHAELLVGTFPVLSRLLRDPGSGNAADEVVNPRERRARVFAAVRELLTLLSRRRLIGIVIDDLQWADADSVALIAEVFEPSHAPSVLFVGTTRLSPEALEEKFGSVMGHRPDVTSVVVGRFREAEASELARALLGRRVNEDGALTFIRTVVKESEGHPLFIGDLVEQYVVATDKSAAVRLEDALAMRIGAQSDVAKRLLAVVSLAELPLPDHVVRAAAEIPASELYFLVAKLRGLHLIETGGSGRGHAIAAFHERVRHAVLGQKTAEEQVALHRRLADALQNVDEIDEEVLARHLRGAGETERANVLLERAARKAAASLAFERAARLFGEAAAHAKEESLARQHRRDQADAFRDAGRLGDAAELLLSLAADEPPLVALDLKRTAAEYFVCSGRFEKGTRLVREALAAVGERFPESPFALIFWLIVARAHLALRGLRFVAVPRGQERSLRSARIGTLWSAGASFSMTDNARGAYFLSRNFLRALDAGDQPAITDSVLMEMCFVSSEGTKKAKHAAVLLAMLERLALEDSRPFTQGSLRVGRGWARYMLGEWPAALVHFNQAEEQLRDRVIGFRFQLASNRTVLYRALAYMGRFEELRKRVPPVWREALKQNDQFSISNMRSNPLFWIGVADDAPDRVEVGLREAEAVLPPSRFLLQHQYVLNSWCNLELYRGRAEASYLRMARTWRTVRRALLLRVQVNRILAYELRGRLAIAYAYAAPGKRTALLDEADGWAGLLSKEGLLCADGPAALVWGLAAIARGESSLAKGHLERALASFERLEMGLYSAATRERLGRLETGPGAASFTAAANVWAERERVVNPLALFQLVAPIARVDE